MLTVFEGALSVTLSRSSAQICTHLLVPRDSWCWLFAALTRDDIDILHLLLFLAARSRIYFLGDMLEHPLPVKEAMLGGILLIHKRKSLSGIVSACQLHTPMGLSRQTSTAHLGSR
jgi:hypothetical protein